MIIREPLKRLIRFSLIIILIFTISCGFGQYVTLEGKQFKDKHGKDFYPLVCNYLVEYIYTDDYLPNLILSPDRSVDGWCFNCNDLTSCLDQMSCNFKKIKEMGFNTIRLMGSNPNYYCKRGEIQGFRIKAWDLSFALRNDCDNSTLNEYHEYLINRPIASNRTVRVIFALIDSVLARAGRAGLYVILVTGRGEGDYSEDYPSHYAKYLKELAKHVHSVSPQVVKEALIAYDIDNEPSCSWNPLTMWPLDTIGHSKRDVYDNVRLFNKRVKKADPDHLITLGGRSFDEIFEYDPSILPIDFYSAHFYPVEKSYDASPFRDKLSRVHGHLEWLSAILKIPFIVGETGFRSEPAGKGPGGSNLDQKYYAEITLEMTRSYGGSGYSWWNYQDYNWSEMDSYYGLTFWDRKNHSLAEKPVADVFRKYDPSKTNQAFTIPGNYYDPFNHRRFNPNRHHVSGHVQDHEGRPIKNAFILGWTPINKDETGTINYEPHYTFSNENGDFTIIPYDSDPVNPPNTEVMAEIRVTAAGYSRFKSGWYDTDRGVPLYDYRLIVLHKLKF